MKRYQSFLLSALFVFMMSATWSLNAHALMEKSAFHLEYVGNGTIFNKNPAIKSKKYQMKMTLERLSAQKVKVQQTSQIGTTTNHFNYIVEQTSKFFYQLYDLEMNPIGQGYCYRLKSFNGKKCHYDFDIHGVKRSQVFTTKNDELYGMGSTVEGNNFSIWRESLKMNFDFPTP